MPEIKISQLFLEPSTQCRQSMRDDTIQAYADAMEAGDEFPPIEVFEQDGTYFLADGWHRLRAVIRRPRTRPRPNQPSARDHGNRPCPRHPINAPRASRPKSWTISRSRKPKETESWSIRKHRNVW